MSAGLKFGSVLFRSTIYIFLVPELSDIPGAPRSSYHIYQPVLFMNSMASPARLKGTRSERLRKPKERSNRRR
jgi:hypothetical protein